MAKLGKRQMIAVPPDVYEEIYTLKGPGKSFGDFIRELLDTLYPQETEDPNQTTLGPICPSCGKYSLVIDSDGEYYCNSCKYEPEPEEL